MREKIYGLIRNCSGWRRYLLTFFAGALTTLALPPFDFLPVAFIGFSLLVVLIDASETDVAQTGWRKLRPAFITGWMFGFGYFLAGLWWIGMALLVDAENFAWALPLAILGLPAFLAFFFAFAVATARLFWWQGISRILILAICIGISEWLRAFVLTGFPWNAVGYAAMPVPLLMQSVTITGLYGMNILAVLVFSMPAILFGPAQQRHGWRSGIILALALISADIGYGAWRLHQAPALHAQSALDAPQIRLVQASVAQDAKWDNQLRRAIFDKHLDLSVQPPVAGQKRPDVIIWPETSVPYVLPQTEQAVQEMGRILQPGQILLAGAVRAITQPTAAHDPNEASAENPGSNTEAEREPLYFNSIFAIDHNGEIIGSVDKVHLVPFGEYLPLETALRALGMQEVIELPGGFTPAAMRHALTLSPQLSLLPLICYEVIFPSELSYEGPQAKAIVNVTNDAWYGNTPGPYQHFRQAQLRAVEQGLPLLRAANNGISAIVDPYGRITAEMHLNEIGFIDGALPETSTLFWGKAAGSLPFCIILLTMLTVSWGFHVTRTKRYG